MNSKSRGISISKGVAYRVITKSGSLLHPQRLQWLDPDSLDSRVHPPLPLYTDLLAGLAAWQLILRAQSSTPSMCPISLELWEEFEPNPSLFLRAGERLRKHFAAPSADQAESTDKFSETLSHCLKEKVSSDSIDLDGLCSLIEDITELEVSHQHPLLYFAGIELKEETRNSLLELYSLLFHLRSLAALDHNARVRDSAFETLKVDPIGDYLSKPEYVVNDALLAHGIEDLLRQDTRQLAQVRKLLSEFSHNGYYLYKSMPADFFTKTPESDIAQELYQYQLDWLMGSDAGLLFRCREELYGLRDGYDQVFWPEYHAPTQTGAKHLLVHCEVPKKVLKQAG